MEAELLSIKFLGAVSIILSAGFVLCVLAKLGYELYIKFNPKEKEIEVRTKNSNFHN